MRKMFSILTVTIGVLVSTGCEQSANQSTEKSSAKPAADNQHTHEDGSTHDDHGEKPAPVSPVNLHDESSLGKVQIGSLEVALNQGHGKVAAGKEGHLVVKLPYNDKGATTVRVWIGTDDRTLSVIGKGDYTASSDKYDIHAVAPDPLPENVMWWIEIEKPDGTKVLGSAKPLR